MRASQSNLHIPSIFQLAMSGLGLLFTLPAVIVFALVALTALARGDSAPGAGVTLSLAATLLTISLLLLPSLVLALLRLMGRPLPQVNLPGGLRLAIILLLIWPLVILLGWWASQNELGLFVLPLLQVFAIGIPLFLWLQAGRHSLPVSRPQREWGILGFSVLITPALIVIIEGMVMLLLIVAFAVWVGLNPAVAARLTPLLESLETVANDPEALMALLQPYLLRPEVLAVIMVLVAVIMPLIEELFKPLALWLVAGRLRTPAEGFVAGMICGAGFALVESLGFAGSSLNSSWAALVTGRVGSGLLHVVASGLVGWGIALAWQQRRYLALLGLYLLAAFLHGLWNFFGILDGIRQVMPDVDLAAGLPVSATVLLPFALIALGVTLFASLLRINARLRLSESAAHAVQ